jgi:acylphosphatase
MSASTAAAEILVEGRVQGVGFRAFAERRASLLGLVGYVANLPDGRVRVHVEGEPNVIETLLADLRVGPRLARVTRADVRWLPPTGEFFSFDVRAHGEVG